MSHGYSLGHHRVTWLGLRRPARTRRAAVLRADLYHIVVDGLFYSLMLGFAEMYYAKFVLALKLGQVASGLITTVPMVLAAALSLVSPSLLRRSGSFATYIGALASWQAFMLVPLASLAFAWPFLRPFVESHSLQWLVATVVFFLITLYFFGALASAAPWMTSTGALIPARIRARYAARRLRLLQVAVLAALLLHGLCAEWIAELFAHWPALARTGLDPELTGLGAMFLAASACRFVSAWHLFRYSPPRESPAAQNHVHASDFLARFANGRDGRFLVYAIFGNAALQIAQPYFNPFMLRPNAFSGATHEWVVHHLGAQAPYSLLLAAIYLGRILMLDASGAIAQRHGSRRLLWLGGLALPFMSVFWLWSDDFLVLLAGQVATGAALAAWELGTFLMNFDSIRPEERTVMLTYFTLANESGKTGGSLAGGWLLSAMGKTDSAYAAVFWCSFVARAATLALLARVRKIAAHERH